MKPKTYLLSFIFIALAIMAIEFVTVAIAQAQSPFRIQQRCQAPNASTYGSITVVSSGDIRQVPCPSRDNIFTGNADFSSAIIRNPFRIGDPNYDNYYGTPLVNLLTAGWGTLSARKTIPSGGVFTLAEFGANLTIPAVTTYTTGLLTALDVQGGGNNMSVRGHYINIFSNGTTPSGVFSELVGSDINVDIGAAYNSAYGLRINTLSGGSGASGLENIYGMQATVNMAHNGNTTNAFGGDFYLSSSNSSPSVVTTGNILRARALIRDGISVTTLTGLKVGNWALQGAGTTTNTIGLHLDNTIDLGTATRYAIKSDSISDSLFAGAVRGVINPYDATAWNGSNKFATEDAIRDVLVSGGAGITGAGVVNQAAFFTGVTSIANVPFQFVANQFKLFRVTNADVFKLDFTGAAAAGSGDFRVGNDTTVENYIQVDGAQARIKLATRDARFGDTEGFGNGTVLRVDDTFSSSAIRLTATTFDLSSNTTFLVYYRTNIAAGTTGAQTINRPLGSVNFAAGATSLVVTNSTADANSLIFLTPQANDATCKSFAITRAAGSFTITANAACTGETRVAFQVTN